MSYSPAVFPPTCFLGCLRRWQTARDGRSAVERSAVGLCIIAVAWIPLTLRMRNTGYCCAVSTALMEAPLPQPDLRCQDTSCVGRSDLLDVRSHLTFSTSSCWRTYATQTLISVALPNSPRDNRSLSENGHLTLELFSERHRKIPLSVGTFF